MIDILLQKILDFITNKFTNIISLLTSISEKDFAPVVEDITDQLIFDDTTTDEESRVVECYKYGNIISLVVSQIKNKGYIPQDNGNFVFFSGLPKPKSEIGYNTSLTNATTKDTFRVRVSLDGELKMWFQEAYDMSTFYGIITYVCDDTPVTPDENNESEGD